MNKLVKVLFCVVMSLSAFGVLADRTINSVTFTPSSVTASGSVQVDITVTGSGSRQDRRWRSTGYSIGGGSIECENTTNYASTDPETDSFTISAPATAGDYDYDFYAYSDGNCSTGQSSAYQVTLNVTSGGGGGVNDTNCPLLPPADEQTGVIINELDNTENWVEFYIPANSTIDFNGWQLELNAPGNSGGNGTYTLCSSSCSFAGGTEGTYVAFGNIPDEAKDAGVNYVGYDFYEMHPQIQEIILTDNSGQLVHYLSYTNNSNTQHFERLDCLTEAPDFVTTINNPQDNTHFCTNIDGDIQVSNSDFSNWTGCDSSTIGVSNDEYPQNISLSPSSIVEYNAVSGTEIGQLSVSPEVAGDLTFSILTDASDASFDGTCDSGIGSHWLFNIDGSALDIASSDIPEASYTLCIGVEDESGNKYKKNITIDVTATPADANFFNIDEDEIYENLAYDGSEIGSFVAADLGASMDLTYSLLNNDGNTQTGSCSAGTEHNYLFDIVDGTLEINSNSYIAVGDYTICVRADSADGHSIRKNFVISVLAVVDGSNYFNISNDTVDESNAAVGDIIGAFAPADDGAGLTLTYEISYGDNSAVGTCTGAFNDHNWKFEIDGANLQVLNTSGAANLPAGDYEICVKATDENGIEYLKDFTISVTDGSAVCYEYNVSISDFVSAAGLQTVTVQAVTDAGLSCASSYSGSQPVTIDFSYTTPNSGSQNLLYSASEIAIVSGTGLDTNLTFDASTAIATFDINYKDAGQLQLSVSDQNNNIITGTDDFIVVPNALQIVMTDGGGLQLGAVGNLLHFAEQAFNFTIQAVNAEGAVTPNYSSGDLELDPVMSAPLISAGAAQVNFTYASNQTLATNNTSSNWYDATGVSFSSGSYSFANAMFDNVGTFAVDVRDANYLGYEINSSAGAVSAGQFTPAYFAIGTVTAAALADTRGNAQGTFTYIDETFDFGAVPTYTYTAMTFGNNVATNYTFNLAAFGFGVPSYVEQSGYTVFTSPATATTATVASPFSGFITLTLAGGFQYVKNPTPVNPITVSLSLTYSIANLSDANGIGYDIDGIIGGGDPVYAPFTITATGVEARYGRLNVENGYGSEQVNYKLDLTTQFFSGGAWVTNTFDSNTTFNNLTATVNNPYSLIVADNGGAVTTFTNGTIPNAEGVFIGSANTAGTATVSFTNIPTFLNFDWDQDGVINTNDAPSSTIIFGTYRGNDRIIYKRER